MKKVNFKDIIKTFNKIKHLAIKSFENGDHEKALKHISTAAELAYKFNWIYTDDDLEKLLKEIGERVIIKNKFSPKEGRIVFYDVFCIENRGLTQQYIRALMNWDIELLYIFEGNNLDGSNKIIKELKAYPKAKIFWISTKLADIEKMQQFYNVIVDFQPEKAFLHLHPSSAMAVSLWNCVPQTLRYQINLTDHAFWLGIKCIDFSLEFRNYGCTVSYEKRNLPKRKLLIQPYYPIMECKPFIGFPEQIKGDAIKIFTGGAYYKMYGGSGLFFKLLKILFELNSKVVVLLAGSGDDTPIKKFVSENKYEERLFLLGSRPDITHVFEKSDIYLSTFPITGGLMGQYAASLAKPILSYTSEDIPCNCTEGFLDWNINSDFKITHTSLDSFVEEALKLIENKSYRIFKGEENKKHIISEDEFSNHLKQLIELNTETPFEKETINYKVFSNIYIESENEYLKQFNFFLVKRFRFQSFLLFPRSILSIIFDLTNWQIIVNKIIRKIK